MVSALLDPDTMPVMEPRRVKVVGERNVGTNVLETLLRVHTNAVLLDSTVPAAVKRVAQLVKSQRPTDAWFSLSESRNGGWKHADGVRIAATMCHPRLRSAAVAMLIRDPWSWLHSTYKRPYHWAHAGFSSFTSFLSTPMPTVRREYGADPPTLTPVEAWNRKAHGLMALAEHQGGSTVARYEDLVDDCDAVVAQICRQLDLRQLSPAVLPEHGVKPDDHHVSAEIYVDRLRTAAHLDAYNDHSAALVASNLDPHAVANFGYSVTPTRPGLG